MSTCDVWKGLIYDEVMWLFSLVTGAKINEYLLEKSRVVYQSPHEQNFHVFYWMLSGLSSGLRERLELGPKISFRCFTMLSLGWNLNNVHYTCQMFVNRYLQTGNAGGDDYVKEFRHLKLSLDLVGFGEDVSLCVCHCLCHLLLPAMA